MVVESEDHSHLSYISNYHAGWLVFNWMPATAVGATPEQRAAWHAEQEAQAVRRGVPV